MCDSPSSPEYKRKMPLQEPPQAAVVLRSEPSRPVAAALWTHLTSCTGHVSRHRPTDAGRRSTAATSPPSQKRPFARGKAHDPTDTETADRDTVWCLTAPPVLSYMPPG